MNGLGICLLGCYGLMMKVFGLELTVTVMMERLSQTLKVQPVRNKCFLRTFLQQKTKENGKIYLSPPNLPLAFSGVSYKFLQWSAEEDD